MRRYASFLFLASDQISNNYFYTYERGGTLGKFHQCRDGSADTLWFDERLWGCMVDYVTVGMDSGLTVVFQDGRGGGVLTNIVKNLRIEGISKKVQNKNIG